VDRTELHIRIPVSEKDEVRAEARRNNISMSALVRISLIQSREAREREALKRMIYPGKPVIVDTSPSLRMTL
jgi:SepF-like predicted cell division protein (DUF552 family)